jgi:hypothetical protein
LFRLSGPVVAIAMHENEMTIIYHRTTGIIIYTLQIHIYAQL